MRGNVAMISHLGRLSLLLLCAFVYASLTGCAPKVTDVAWLEDFVKDKPYQKKGLYD